ncbi:MAG: carbohydrate ABC transporter permease [Mycobacterium leprae]
MGTLKRGSRPAWRQWGFGYALTLPAIVVIFLVILYPMARGIQMSFQNITLFNLSRDTHAFVGFKNYVGVFANPDFWRVIKNTAVWTVVNTVVQIALGLGAALLLNQKLKGQGIFRAVALIPWIVPSVVAVLTWRWMYDSGNGIFGYWLIKLGLAHEYVNWLGNISTALGSVIVQSIWKGTPFVLIMFLSGLQAIPNELYEAAAMDGANNWHILWRVIVPVLKRTIAVATILTVVFTLNNFNSVWLMTQGGPLHSSEILLTYAYKVAFQDFNLGQASAISVVMFVFLAVISTIYIGLVERGEGN